MKVAKWKVLSIAGALVLGYAASSKAVQIKVSDEQFLDLGVTVKAWYLDQGKRVNDEYSKKLIYSKVSASVEGQLNENIQFSADLFDKTSGYINFVIAPQLQIELGKDTVPFARYQLAGSSSAIIPVDTGIVDPNEKLKADNFVPGDHGLIKFHGDILGTGMLTYQVAFFLYDKGEVGKSLSFAARLDFAPVNMGFAPAGAYKHSYLGKKDVLNIGLGYAVLKRAIQHGGNYKDVKGYTVDFMYEKSLADMGIALIPNFQVGYIKLKNTHEDDGSLKNSHIWNIQGQLLYDEVVCVGKPAIAFQYDKLVDDRTPNDAELTRFGLAFNYYIIGHNAKISVGFNKYNYDNVNVTDPKDFYIFAQVKF